MLFFIRHLFEQDTAGKQESSNMTLKHAHNNIIISQSSLGTIRHSLEKQVKQIKAVIDLCDDGLAEVLIGLSFYGAIQAHTQ